MKCYIYRIVNNITQQVYVGQTTNFSRRINEHIIALKSNKHPNPKLQASWNKYGEENFSITKEKYDCTKAELDQKEINTIAYFNSFENGFNLTRGGTGGDTKSKIPLNDFLEIYWGNKVFDGLCNRTASVYGCDSSTVSAIKREKAYDYFRDIALSISEEEKNNCINNFKEKMNLTNKPPKPQRKKLEDSEIVEFLCLLSCYKRGLEAAFIREKGLSKGLGYHLQKGEYINAQKQFSKLSDQEVQDIGTTYFDTHNLQSYCVQRIKINEKVLRPSWVAH